MKAAWLLGVMTCGAHAVVLAQTPRSDGFSTRDSALAQNIAGCYQLVETGWRSDSALLRIAPIPHTPLVFELTAHPARGWADLSVYEHATYFDARADSTRSADWYPVFTTWQRLGADSTVLVSRPLPMAGLALRLTPSGEHLAGSIVAFTDAIPPDGKSQATHPATARRVPCLHSKR
jgi:hypothetical protein